MQEIPVYFPPNLMDDLRERITVDFIAIDDLNSEAIDEEAGIYFKTHLIMAKPVSNIQYITVLNTILDHGMLNISPKKPPPDPFGFELYDKNTLEAKYITKKGLFGQKLTGPIIEFEPYLNGETYPPTEEIIFNGKYFTLLSELFNDLPARNVSIFGAILYANLCGFQVPTRVQWEMGASSLSFPEKPRIVYETRESEKVPIEVYSNLTKPISCLRFSDGSWQTYETGDIVNKILTWEWTSERVSALHYNDLSEDPRQARGAYRIMKLVRTPGGRTTETDIAPATASSRKSPCIVRLVYFSENLVDVR
jgi:hypothetical protein